MRHAFLALVFLSLILFLCSDVLAQRGGGRGHGGGGGARSSPSRGPSMSRPSRSTIGNVPNVGIQPNIGNRPNVGNRPNIGNRPNVGNELNVGNQLGVGLQGERIRPANRANAGVEQFAGTGSRSRPRAQSSQLNSFLDLPKAPSFGSSAGNRSGTGTRPVAANRAGPRTGVNARPGRGPGKRTVSLASRKQVANTVRGNWRGRAGDQFTNNWFSGRPGWNSRNWRYQRSWNRDPANDWWKSATAAAITTWFTNAWRQPVYFNYGKDVYYQNGSVYQDGQVIATADEYFEQASRIAANVPDEVDEEKTEWMPLGVFALTQPGTDESNMLLQLAVSEEGIIAGTFYNEATDVARPIEGMVDKETQRTAWRATDGKNPSLVIETGIYNLAEDQTTALVHFGSEKTQEWLMVRLEEPKADSSE